MKRFVTGEDRCQESALSGRLDDHVAEDSPARVVDVFAVLCSKRHHMNQVVAPTLVRLFRRPDGNLCGYPLV
jgi:hypothetical protein